MILLNILKLKSLFVIIHFERIKVGAYAFQYVCLTKDPYIAYGKKVYRSV